MHGTVKRSGTNFGTGCVTHEFPSFSRLIFDGRSLALLIDFEAAREATRDPKHNPFLFHYFSLQVHFAGLFTYWFPLGSVWNPCRYPFLEF